jgi:hypothetical protein
MAHRGLVGQGGAEGIDDTAFLDELHPFVAVAQIAERCIHCGRSGVTKWA